MVIIWQMNGFYLWQNATVVAGDISSAAYLLYSELAILKV